MAGDRDPWPLWAQEATGTSGRPRVAPLLLVALVLVLAALVTGADDGGRVADHDRAPSLCEQHAGRPGWAAVCADE